jgi:hypothetical protein
MFTLLAGLLLSVAVFAAHKRPVVTIKSEKNYKVVIDGKSYFGNAAGIRISSLAAGTHSIRVYEMKRGLFDRGERLVSSTTFRMGKKDVRIRIDHFGRVTVVKQKGRNGRNVKLMGMDKQRMESTPRF